MDTISDEYQTLRLERFSELRESLTAFIRVGAIGDRDQRLAAATKLHTASSRYLDLLPTASRQPWLLRLVNLSRDARTDAHVMADLMQHIAEVHYQIDPGLADIPIAHSFDQAFETVRSKFKLSELFDRLVQELERIIQSGEVDSHSILMALQKLMAVLRANRGGSFAAMKQSGWFVRYGRNLLREVAKEIPVLRTLVQAYEATANEYEQEFEKAEREMLLSMVATVGFDERHIQKVTSKTTVELLEFSSNTLLPTRSLDPLDDESVASP